MEDINNSPTRVYRRPSCILSTLEGFSVFSKRPHEKDWENQLRKVLKGIGFEWYLLSLGDPQSTRDPFSRITTTYPEAWIDRYKSKHFIRVDPIVKHCCENLAPLLWENERCQASGATVEFWGEREKYGLRRGISIPLRHNDMVGSLNAAYLADNEDAQQSQWSESIGSLFILVPFLLEGIKKKRELSTVCTITTPSLTGREAECLKWSGVGKSSWEIGHIIGCSERTVNFHVGNATRKLGAYNRRQAVGVAIAQGLINL
jgi:LuxR family quorum-sensing transcriptional regulator LasR